MPSTTSKELDKLYATARAIHSDDLTDESELDWIREKNAWLEQALKDMQLTIEKAEKLLEESNQRQLMMNSSVASKKRYRVKKVIALVEVRKKLSRVA